MSKSNFYLSKWFLDFVGQDGETMIFYAARMSIAGIEVRYASWKHFHPDQGIRERSHFGEVQLPVHNDKLTTWHDKTFDISAAWQGRSPAIRARLFEDKNGHIDWNCLHPSAEVTVQLKDRELRGQGYVEELEMSTYPWNIAMDELLWGRLHTPQSTMVWIAFRGAEPQQWFWHNGEKREGIVIEDGSIKSQNGDFELLLDRGTILESERKISNIVDKLLRFLPGFNKVVALSFLRAHSHKWLSRCELKTSNQAPSRGWAIHEKVNFSDARI